MSTSTSPGSLKARTGSTGIDKGALSLAAIIFMTTLNSQDHVFLLVTPFLTFFWILVSDVTRTRFGDVRFSVPVILICAGAAFVFTAKAILAVTLADTGAGNIITVTNFRNAWVGYMLWLVLLLLMGFIFTNTSRHVLQRAIRLALALHIAGFLAQFLAYHLFGYLLDFSGWIGGQSARTFYIGTYFRPTGFSYEPSTVVGIMIVLFACDALIAKRVSIKLTVLMTVLSILSFSTAAWGFAAFMMFILLPVVLRNKWLGLFMALGLVVLAGLAMQTQYAQVQATKFGTSSGLRSGMVSYAFIERPMWKNIFGPASNGMSLDYYKKRGYESRNTATLGAASGAGTALYLFILYGIVGLGCYFIFFAYAFRRLALPIFLLLLLASMTKITPHFLLFAVLAAAAWLDVFPTGEERADPDLPGKLSGHVE